MGCDSDGPMDGSINQRVKKGDRHRTNPHHGIGMVSDVCYGVHTVIFCLLHYVDDDYRYKYRIYLSIYPHGQVVHP
jgi:hypothetical protein